MKTLGLCLLLSLLASIASAQVPQSTSSQDASPTSTLNLDKDAIPKWLADAGKPGWNIDDAPASVWSADADSSCAFIRTCRVKREHRGSDVVRPAGYTTCVPMTRFETKNAVLQLSPQ